MATPSAKVNWDALHLLEGVREVASSIAGDDIATVSQRPFDDARSRSFRFACLPPARRICERLDLSWSDTLRLASLPPTDRAKAYGVIHGEARQNWLTPEYVDFVLKLVAGRLGVLTRSRLPST